MRDQFNRNIAAARAAWCLGILAIASCTPSSSDGPSENDDESDGDAGDDTGDDSSSPLDSDSESDSWGPAPGSRVALNGVNLSGAEFGSAVPGLYDVDYTYPRVSSLDYFIAKGMNVFRVPVLWERLQPTLYGELDEAERSRLIDLVEGIANKGGTAILDLHNYARYEGQVLGEEIAPDALADVWSRLAALFLDEEKVIFGLMNEPHDLATETWRDVAETAVAAIREVGATHLVLVPGNGWTGAHSWTADYYGTPNGEVMADFYDPADHFAFEVHQYLDSDSSGAHYTCVSEQIGVERLSGFVEWARALGVRGFLAEFGVGDSADCLLAVDNMLLSVGENSDVWLGWTWWSAGPWWGDYPMSVEPDGDEDKPQMAVLSRHLSPPSE